MKKIAIFSLFALFLSGCWTVEVPVVETWEGRYSTVEEFKTKTDAI